MIDNTTLKVIFFIIISRLFPGFAGYPPTDQIFFSIAAAMRPPASFAPMSLAPFYMFDIKIDIIIGNSFL
jgi:hypothetical protein